ncbi:hypothetical protein [Hymenobacter mucosus]|uniref:Nucleotide-diphospho-sugar transferase n=1 Tax=Hymenobacter mucosus TaxID=1411120 RepID=A0A238YHF7_9BACT|nr:hypothetical protein [Hymenobacter mucosus]SNR70043.1 hypothetical protein SAMN06269173_105211 [Hymenobacter mucosus]
MHLLVTQSFGRESEYRRALLTIMSFWAWYSGPASQVKTVLFTDAPDFFRQYLTDVEVDYVLLTPEKIKVMRGQIDFLHRMKIALIEEAFQRHPGADMLYVDSDTFFTADALPWMQDFRPGRSFMHLLEYTYEECRKLPLPMGVTFHAFLHLIEQQSFQTTRGTEQYTARQESWNAGVMGLPAEIVAMIPDVYQLTDQFYPPTQNHASEQYAFSLVLQTRTELHPCDQYVYHYWYRVKKQVTDLVLADTITAEFKQQTWADKLAAVRRLTQQLPAIYDTHPLMLQDNAVQAFNENRFKEGYQHAWIALRKSPFTPSFLKDVLYHAKRHITQA